MLVLSQNKLTEFAVLKIPTLVRISLAYAFAGPIPASSIQFSGLDQLRSTDLSGCHLTELPNSITSCSHLKVLEANSNKLSAIPEWISSIATLSELRLARNQIKSLPDSMAALKALQGN